MQNMLQDLAKVDGLGMFWQMLGLAMQVSPDMFTSGERGVIASVQNETGLAAETGDSEQKSGSVVDSGERTLTPYFKPVPDSGNR